MDQRGDRGGGVGAERRDGVQNDQPHLAVGLDHQPVDQRRQGGDPIGAVGRFDFGGRLPARLDVLVLQVRAPGGEAEGGAGERRP